MSKEMNKGVEMHCKTVTAILLTIVRLLVEPITSLVKPKDSLEAYISIRKPPLTVTFSKTVISPSLFRSFYFGNILRSNRYWWSTVLSYVVNSADCCGGRNATGKMKCTAIRNCLSIIDLIKRRYVISGVPVSGEKRIVEAILSKSVR